jgi:hypothetical protein
MQNLSPLLLANHSLVEQLVKTLYDDFMVVKDDRGEDRLIFTRDYQGRKIYFDERGRLILYRAAIAFFLETDKQSVNRTIARLEKADFFSLYPHTLVKLNIAVSSHNNLQRPMNFYSGYVINLIANRITKSTRGAIDFLMLREQIIDEHVEMMMHLVIEAKQRELEQSQSVVVATPPPLPEAISTPHAVAVLAEVVEKWPSLVRKVDRLAATQRANRTTSRRR